MGRSILNFLLPRDLTSSLIGSSLKIWHLAVWGFDISSVGIWANSEHISGKDWESFREDEERKSLCLRPVRRDCVLTLREFFLTGSLGVGGAEGSGFGGNICCLVSISRVNGPASGNNTCSLMPSIGVKVLRFGDGTPSLMLSTGSTKVLRIGDDTRSLMLSTGGVKFLRLGDDPGCQVLSAGGAELLRLGGNICSLTLGMGGADMLRFGGVICCPAVSKVELSKISGRTTLTRESLGLKLLILDLRLPVLDLDTSTTVAKIEICLPSMYFPWALAGP